MGDEPRRSGEEEREKINTNSMEQPLSDWENKQNATRNRKRRGERKGDASNKPWWLVVLIVVLLAGFLFYIKWLNSPAAREYRSFWAYLVEPAPTEIKSDQPAAPADDIAVLFGTDSIANADPGFDDDWAQDTPPAPAPPDDVFSENTSSPPAGNPTPPPPPPRAATQVPVATAGTVYVINAGEFKTKGSAQFRISELRQGNYAARLIEPDSEDGMYKVVVGEYQNEGYAKSVAQSMGFILEIRASVEEKR